MVIELDENDARVLIDIIHEDQGVRRIDTSFIQGILKKIGKEYPLLKNRFGYLWEEYSVE